MTSNETKIAHKFGLTAEEVAALTAAGFITQTQIKAADNEELPEGAAAKIAAWQSGRGQS